MRIKVARTPHRPIYRKVRPPRSPQARRNVVVVAALPSRLPRAKISSERGTHRETRSLLSLVMRQQAQAPVPRHREPRASQSVMSTPTTNDAPARRLLEPEAGSEQTLSRWNLQMDEGAWSMHGLGCGDEVWMEPDDDRRYSQRRRGRFNLDEDRSSSPQSAGALAFDHHILRVLLP